MRTLVATALLAYGKADETSLMQELVTRSSSNQQELAKSRRHDQTSKLLETAMNMVRNGVTPDVITFVDATTADIEDSVLQAIISEHDTDQEFIDRLCAEFTAAVETMEAAKDEINNHASMRLGSSEEHHECRAREAKACAYSRRCEAQLRSKWETVVYEEHEMRSIHAEIEGGWCVRDPTSDEYGAWHNWQAVGEWLTRPFDNAFWAETWSYPVLDMSEPVIEFRGMSVRWFESYMAQKLVVEQAWEEYNAKVVECSGLERDWEAITPVCDAAQEELHNHACEHARQTRAARQTFGQSWARLIHDFELARVAKEANEQDRKNEWETLKIVQCLLDHIHSAVITSIETGAPCPTLESNPDEVTLTIEDCHVVTRGCDEDSMTHHLCLNWCEVPPTPPLPEVEEPPCLPPYVAREQAQFLDAIQASYMADLNANPSFVVDENTYGPYTGDLLTDYDTILSPAGWAGCAPPLVCIDCSDSAPQEPCAGDHEDAHVCHLHEDYLAPGKGNADTFRCLDGTCIAQSGRCNGPNNCADGSDEAHCDVEPVLTYVSTSFTCPDDFHNDVHFRCADSQCIDKVGLCNGFVNCIDGSDELDCHGSLQDRVTVEATSGRQISVETLLSEGQTVFHDRHYTFETPGAFVGKTFIKYSNDDKTTDDNHVMIKVRTLEPVKVTILQQNERPLPWLDREGFTPDGRAGVSYSGVRSTKHKDWDPSLLTEDHFVTPEGKVFSKTFPAGTISIPGNADPENEADDYNEVKGSFLIFLEKEESAGIQFHDPKGSHR